MTQIILTDDVSINGENVLHFSCNMLQEVYDYLKDVHLQDIRRAVEQRNGADSTVADSSPIKEDSTNDACPTCKGTGWILHSHPNQCPTCAPKIGQEITVTQDES